MRKAERHKCLLWDFNVADLSHALFAFLLLFEKFFLTSDVAAITFGEYVCSMKLFMTFLMRSNPAPKAMLRLTMN